MAILAMKRERTNGHLAMKRENKWPFFLFRFIGKNGHFFSLVSSLTWQNLGKSERWCVFLLRRSSMFESSFKWRSWKRSLCRSVAVAWQPGCSRHLSLYLAPPGARNPSQGLHFDLLGSPKVVSRRWPTFLRIFRIFRSLIVINKALIVVKTR